MKKPPGQVDERACRILEDVVSSPDGRIELGEEDRSKLERYQTEFYYLLEKTGDLRFIESITGILDRIAALIPRMLSKALASGLLELIQKPQKDSGPQLTEGLTSI